MVIDITLMLLKHITISLFSIIFFIANLSGQEPMPPENILVIRKVKKNKRVYYRNNNVIVYKTNDTIRAGIINKIEVDSILIDSTWTKYTSIISIIDPYKRNFLKNASVKFPIAGISFAFITTLNSIINGDKPIFYREHLIPSAGLVGLGAVIWPFRTQKYKIGYKWEFLIIPS